MTGNGSRAGKPSELIEAGRLFTRTTERGGDYLVGRLGGLKILVFRKRDGDEGEHSHTLMVAAAVQRNGGGR
ncbi:hypothetical protein [Neoroseomonas oryzicola]|uniref:Uncharacterized protein n=1 Tax=Neoroseomonas oryzicola TaxID=535904 RepID=A0A9X9WLX7_9PROT|nr:hypothetical protein [Neoroseomonas oryzicola]MBR0661337.1 hypothetical protein [Neoroseomonas oryzicola]NKE18827.1 hypothetical protein [Neoroseomonas oryzicola]